MDKHLARAITCPLRVAAWRRPQAPALLSTEGVVTYGNLDARVAAMARQLADQGCQPGDVVALGPTADRETIVALLALLRHGAVACLLNLRNPTATLARQIADMQAKFAFADAAGVLPISGGVVRLELKAEEVDEAPGKLVRQDADRLATLMFTSGSSAEPKAAAHSYGNHYAAAVASNRHNGLLPEDAWLLSLPLYHVGGIAILFRCLLAGAALVLPAKDATLAESVVTPGVTHISLVPTQLQRLMDTPGLEQALAQLKLILLGGAPAPDAMVTKALNRGWPVRKTYGLTEMSSQVATVPPHATGAKRLKAGTMLPFNEVRLATDGEILVRGPSLFCGYYEAGRLVSPMDADGWYATGDLGECDETGYLTVHGRKDNMFISGGENIQPEEIEMALCGIQGVLQAIVVPVPDGEFGQRPVAYVKQATKALDPATLSLSLAAVLPRYKIPDSYRVWPDAADAVPPKRQRVYFKEHVRSLVSEAGS